MESFLQLQPITFELTDPKSEDAILIMGQLSETLLKQTGCSGHSSFSPEDLHSSRSFFVIARTATSIPVGCCALREVDLDIGELKRMFASSLQPGTGTQIMAFVEAEALARRYRRLRLATRKVNLNAIKFYQKHRFEVIDNYGSYQGRSEFICFQKNIIDDTAATKIKTGNTVMPQFIICSVDPSTEEAEQLQAALSATLSQVTGDSGQHSFDHNDVRSPRARFVIAKDANAQAIACGAFRPLDEHIVELKRMYAAPGSKGAGSAVLRHLESEARKLGVKEMWLETRRVNSRAVKFYLKHGYSEIPNFGKYVGMANAICMRKQLQTSLQEV